MKISTKLLLSMFVPVLMTLLVIVALVFSYQDMRRTQENGDAVSQIRSSITELNHIVFSYITYHEERPKQQFVEEHEALTKLIAGTQLQNPDQQLLLDSIRVNNENMEDLFHQLVSNYDRTAGTSELNGTNAQLVSLLLQKSYEADTDAALLLNQINDGINANQTGTIGLIFLIMVLITIPLTFFLSRTRRGITSSFSNLNTGTAIIGSGNLNYRVEAGAKDEIGDLARSFNQMTSNLSNVTASKTELEKEIDERKNAEEALRESEKEYKSLAENIPDIVTRYDRDLHHVFANTEASKAAGIPAEAFIGKTNLELGQEPEQVEFWMKYVRKVFATGKPETMEFQWMTPDGLRYQQTIITPEFDSDGSVKTALCVTHNLTEIKRAEEALKKYTQELESANKELESFAYSVSHDLRQPLRTLDGFSEMVIMDYGDKLDETGKDYLNRIRKAGQTMSQLTEDILKLSRITRAEMHRHEVNLTEIATAIADELKSSQPNRKAEFKIAPDLVVDGDEALLGILLRNLLDNAWKYTNQCPDAKIEMGANLEEGRAIYFVKDNGVGFDMQYKDKLFQPFQRLHTGKEYPGTGIGLATAQRVIRRHGGDIWAESELGKGTTFYFTVG